MQKTKKPKKHKDSLGLRDMYKYYIKDKKPGSPLYVDYKTYAYILKETNKKIAQLVLGGIYHVFLPCNMGKLKVVKKRLDFAKGKLPVDWKSSKEHGRLIYHTNDHTDGYRYKWFWERHTSIAVNKSFFRFVATRTNNRELAKRLNNKEFDCFEKRKQ